MPEGNPNPWSQGQDTKAKEVSLDRLPVLPMLSAVIFPGAVTSIQIGHELGRSLVTNIADGETIGLLLQKHPEVSKPRIQDLYRIGVTARVLNRIRLSEELYQIFLQGLDRMMVESFITWDPFIITRVQILSSGGVPEDSLSALRERVLGSMEQFVTLAPRIPPETVKLIKMNAGTSGELADMIADRIPFELRDRQQILEAIDTEHRLNIILDMLDHEIGNISVMNEISSMAREELDTQQRKMFLRRQLKTIQRELGEDPEQQRVKELRSKIERLPLPDAVRVKAEKELVRLESMSSAFGEYTVILNYLDWIIELPWGVSTLDSLDLVRARDILDRHHFGLDDVKERILEFLAVRYLRKDSQGPVLCFSGPPGVGKTSLGKAIAEALGRKFVRMSVGGMRDENEIRDHRRTYVGAMPGRIVQNLRQAQSNNPVFMIDEIDKMGSDFHGDPSSALLEVLDPAQNSDFLDHYLDIPLDLSKIFFIATANVLPNIPPPLRDRMEIIKLPGYTELEKKEIARRHLLPRQLDASGLKDADLQISDPAMLSLARNYTHEAGVRNLERQIANICRKTAKDIVSGKPGPYKVGARQLEKLLGPEPYGREAMAAEDAVGVVTALAWSEAGGEILFVEAVSAPGHGALKVTGQIGSVMRESAEAAMSFVRTHGAQLGIAADLFERTDVHVHIPEGSVPKDGPSAGLALVTAVASLLSGRPVDHTVAMTGEITLTGRVLPIGGLKEKAIAAHRAGITTVLIPERNDANRQQLPNDVLREMKFIPVGRIIDALEIVLRKTGNEES